ncbi:hypothetical protein FSP39_014761 [Pinctada imbricata]|uniref:EGF-like domain-containing protein n=1 Tax=Pinctada imbricata TaxID=66713 RepID=A0AA88YIH8_PINIB|nr:hypothetical protein FSP39_014761 [Pinctada imbricata]
MMSIIFAFLPTDDSPELALMKQEFSEMNRKLDIITNSLEESKKLIKESTQKAAYLAAEHKIDQAYRTFLTLITNLLNVSCDTEESCRLKKMKVVENSINKLNVRGEVEMILRGAAKDSVFGISLLTLISDTSGCYINKIKNFKSAIAGLAIKGSAASLFFDMATKSEFDVASEVRNFQSLMFDLEKKAENTITKCFENINRHITSSVIDLDQRLAKSSIAKINEQLLKSISLKFYWIEFYVVSTEVKSKSFFWANDTFQLEIQMNDKTESDNQNTDNFVLIGSRNQVENELLKERSFREKVDKTKLHYLAGWFQRKYDKAIERMLNAADYDKYLHDEIKTMTVVPNFQNALVSYIRPDDKFEQVKLVNFDKVNKRDLFAYRQCSYSISCTSAQVAVVATVHSKDRETTSCTKTCNNHGNCFFLPHTKIMACRCNADYYGDDCSNSVSEINMALDLIKMIDISFKLPSLLDISTQLGHVHKSLQASLNDVQSSVQAIDNKLTTVFDTLSNDMMVTLEIHGLLTQYGQIIKDLKYYYRILIATGRDESALGRYGLFHQTNGMYEKMPYRTFHEKEELAKLIIKPTEISRSLDDLSYLFIGRHDVSLISHRPLPFLIMDKHRSKLCTPEYKQIMDNAFRQLETLEFEGFFVWLHALQLAHFDTSFVFQRYHETMAKHASFLDSNMCHVRIDNSVNFADCANGYYIYSGMKEDVKCASNFYRSSTCSWYNSFSCTPCGCSSSGSSSTSCSADGQCKCKSGFRGKRCLSRDCTIGHWGAWSDCECGPGKTKTRERPIVQRRTGSGQQCGTTSESAACNVKCQCQQGEWGETCQHKNCLVSEWGSWGSCPIQVGKYDCEGDENKYATIERRRTVTRARQNSGNPCPNLKEEKLCKKPLCVQIVAHAYWLG